MKKLLLTFGLILSTFCLSQAQLVMNCNGSRTDAKVTFISQKGNMIKLLVDWNEGSTFVGNNLAITNGKCSSCPALGGIGGEHPKQAVYEIEQTNLSQPVTIKWAPPSTSKYCGANGVIVVDNSLFCKNSPTGAKISFLSHEGNIIKLNVDWKEGSTLTKANLKITNGTCSSCPPLGGIGSGPEKQKGVYEITQTSTSKPVTIEWATSGTIRYCGDQKLSIPFDRTNENIVVDIDGNVYNTVEIAGETWMAENLRVTKCNNGTPVSRIQIGESTTGAGMYWHDNNPNSENSKKYGPVYNWSAVTKCDVCPSGWRVPTQDEWNKVLRFWYGKNGNNTAKEGLTYAAKQLRQKGNIWPNNESATNSTGFSAVPGGWLWRGRFSYLTSRTAYWATYSGSPRFTKIADGNNGTWTGIASTKDNLYIRCIKE